MIGKRDLTIEDYLAMLRRRMKVIVIPALFAPLAGWLSSYVFPPKYTAQAAILVVGQEVPANMVQPLVDDEDLTLRIETLQQQALSPSSLRPMVERLGLVKPGQDADAVMDGIRQNMSVSPMETDLTQTPIATEGKKKAPPAKNTSAPGFYVGYTAANPTEAQKICNGLASLVLEENLKFTQNMSEGTADFLSQQLDEAKRNLDDLDAKLADFKRKYTGQLPGDEDTNMKILTGLNSQLDANTQQLNRAQQDKAYTESLLGQQLAAWKSLQSTTNPQTLEKQLSDLQTLLLQLEARYTDDHPDVIKTKADIAEVKKKLAEINKAAAQNSDPTAEKASATEPAAIQQLRMQLHQYSDLIASATRDQKRLQEEISLYQGRVALSPEVEEQYKQMARDYSNAQQNYQDLLANKDKADATHQMELQQKGEQLRLLSPASAPDAPSFPNRLLFAGGGLAAGLALGAGIAVLLEFRDSSIRTQTDVEAAMELPMLVSVPWVGEAVPQNGGRNGGFWKRKKKVQEHERTVGV
ncbi:MAG TPA: Wzz/FepE/Etk N-terminal domain-containing protein [Candidatus Aquilonibacter sp.]|nr:Wzz/FepE/Etk N-terminal domain-containing protein [Candidatus Aquilonibacter sp.]